MAFSSRFVSVAALGLATALVATGCAATPAAEPVVEGEEVLETIDVNFGYIPDFNGTSLLAIAEDQGIWDKYALNVTTLSFTNGPLQIQALGTGDLDFGYIGPGAMWLPASGQAQVVAINTLGKADRVVAQPGIESMEDLRGKTVAVPEGTSGDMILTLALAEAGMTKDDIELVPMEPSAIVAALSSGQVQGAGFWYPGLATVKENVPGLVELAQNTDFVDQIAFPTAFVASNELVDNDPEKVNRVLAAIREAIDFRATNTDEAIALTAAFLAISEEQVAADAGNVEILTLAELDEFTTDGTINTWLSGMVEYFLGAGKLTETADPADFYTGDLFVGAGE